MFIGAFLAFAVVDRISALAVGAIATFVPAFWVGIGSGLLFIVFGALFIWSALSGTKLL